MSNEEIAIKIYKYTRSFNRSRLFCNDISLDEAFTWISTDEGSDFWLNQYKKIGSRSNLTKFMLEYFNNHFIDLSLI